MKELVEVLLERLSPAHSEVLTMKYFDHLTEDQIAERQNVKVGTVFSRLSRAKKAAFAILEEIDDDLR